MSGFNATALRAQFVEQLEGRARSVAAERAAKVAPVREQLRAAIPAELYAALETAEQRLHEAQADEAAARQRKQALDVAQADRGGVAALVRDRALAGAELVEYGRLTAQAQQAHAAAAGAVQAAARRILEAWQAAAWQAYEQARATEAAEVARLEAEHRRALAEAEQPTRAAAAVLDPLRLMAQELGIQAAAAPTMREVTTPATRIAV